MGTKSANVNVAAKRAAWGALLNSGQTCVRPDYHLVHEDVGDAYVAALKKVIAGFYNDNPADSEWYGRLVNKAAFERLHAVVQDGDRFIVHPERDHIDSGSNVNAATRYIEPTILDFGTDKQAFEESLAMKDENFGPIIPIYRYKDIEEVIRFVKRTAKPLALYCFTTDKSEADMVLKRTTSGGAIINDVVVHLSNSNLPFGGVGESGMGTYHGKKTFDCFSHQKAVLKRSSWLDPPQRYPPYTWDKKIVMNLAFVPQVGYFFDKMITLISSKRNFVILALLWYIFGMRRR